MGIDTIRVRGQINRFFNLLDFDRINERRSRTNPSEYVITALDVRLPCGVLLHVEPNHLPQQAIMEFSVPNVMYGHNLVATDVATTKATIASVAEEAARFVEWTDTPESFDVMRLDLDRDFWVADRRYVADFLNAGWHLALPYHPDARSWRDTKGNVTSLHRGKPGWKCSLYDKAAERLDAATAAPPGPERATLLAIADVAQHYFRNEVRLRREVLRKSPIRKVEDMTTQLIEEQHRKYFNRAGFGTEAGSVSKIKAAYLLANADDQKMLHDVFGLLLAQYLDMPVHKSPNTIRKIKRAAKSMNLSPADVGELREISVRLDYDNGELIVGGESGVNNA